MADMGRIVLTERPTKIVSTVSDATEIDVVASQSKKFNNNYKSNRIDDLYKEFDSITLTKGQIEESNARAIGMKKREFKKRLVLSTAMIVSVLFIFLAIFNIFVINKYSASIESLQRDYATAKSQMEAVNGTYDDATNQAKIIQELEKRGYKIVNG